MFSFFSSRQRQHERTMATLNKITMDAAERMSAYGIRRIVVVHDDVALAGLLTAGDLAKWLAMMKGYSDSALNAIARLKGGTGGPYV